MSTQSSTNLIAALVAAGFLLIAAWGSAHALVITLLLSLLTSTVLLCRRGVTPCDLRLLARAALVGILTAAVFIALAERLH